MAPSLEDGRGTCPLIVLLRKAWQSLNATEDHRDTEYEPEILIPGTVGLADLVGALDQQEVQDDFVPDVE